MVSKTKTVWKLQVYKSSAANTSTRAGETESSIATGN